ncbi:hypothetical protein GQ53DRAFT_843981 [Thozetella sp. PMI_491]|nr:hypothetical protein GQ53DRAFT_843981 [Thozetella sp. PMI_491]
MESHVVSDATPLPPRVLLEIAAAGALDEISNAPDSVRHYIYWTGLRDKEASTLLKPLFFFVYESGRGGGPHAGFRLCMVRRGFFIDSPTKAGNEGEDDIDRVEMPIPRGHTEVVIL